VLEAPDNKLRVDWLSALQFNRKQYYQQTNRDLKSSTEFDFDTKKSKSKEVYNTASHIKSNS
jgi:hypothetical protein